MRLATPRQHPSPTLRRSPSYFVPRFHGANGLALGQGLSAMAAPNSKPFSYRAPLMLPCADACPELLETPPLPRTHA